MTTLRRWRRISRLRLTVTEITAVLALAVSLTTAYLQFHTRHELSAVVTGMSASFTGPDQKPPLHVRVDVALVNEGTAPEIVSGGSLMFGLCPDLKEAPVAVPETMFGPFVIGPKEKSVHRLEVDVQPTDVFHPVGPSAARTCDKRLRAGKGIFFVGVSLGAIQSDGRLTEAHGLGGLVVDAREMLGAQQVFPRISAIRSPTVAPFVLIPAKRGDDLAQYWFEQAQQLREEVRRLDSADLKGRLSQ
ncbi:MAG: hypothetical protein JWN63_2825 [Candidatus Acidoferrum typicum]|nr:hypothetical protein [Candidatus Acidoferrum typicum]